MKASKNLRTPPDKLQLLLPYRAQIDALDREIIELLVKRYAIIREVGHMKAREGIESILQDRVDEVRENATSLAAAKGLDEDFIRHLYAQLIEHSCNTEEEIRQSLASLKKAAG